MARVGAIVIVAVAAVAASGAEAADRAAPLPVKSKARATGLGLLIGDGALNCREEKIIEGYYAYKIDKTSTPTAAISSSITRRTTPTADRRRSLTGRFHAEF
jgi:hypothetical protein